MCYHSVSFWYTLSFSNQISFGKNGVSTQDGWQNTKDRPGSTKCDSFASLSCNVCCWCCKQQRRDVQRRGKTFLGALAKRGASNSLILPGRDGDQQGKTSAFFESLRTMLLETLWIFWILLNSYILLESFGIFWNLSESFGIFWNLLESFGIF